MVKKKRDNLKKLLREIVSIIVGKQAEEIADLLDGDKYVNEFSIARKLGITINQTRNILYKIADQGLVSSIRKKDKRKGWYTYFWKIEIIKALEFLEAALNKRIDQIRNQIKSRETKQFYVCELCNVEFNEENALLKDFTCSECGSVFVVKDNAPVLKELRKNLTRMDSELSFVKEEMEIENEKLDKKRIRDQKKAAKEKAAKRAAKRKANAKKREALKKAVGESVKKKKVSTKKSTKKKKVTKKKASVKKKTSLKKKVTKKSVSKKTTKKKLVKKKVVKKKTSTKKTTKKKVVKRSGKK